MPKQVLVVDDEKDVLELIRTVLESDGYQVHLAVNGQQALDAIAAQPPDLVVLDVMMPFMDGFEVLRRLKADDGTAHIPVLMLTAKDQNEDVLNGWRMGVEFYLTKPFVVEELSTYARIMLEG